MEKILEGIGSLFKNMCRIMLRRSIILAMLAVILFLPSWAGAYQEAVSENGVEKSKTQTESLYSEPVAVSWSEETVHEEIIARGAVLKEFKLTTGEGPLSVYVLKIDLTDPYINLDTIIGTNGTFEQNSSVLDMAKRTGAVAAVNGDFFQIKESKRPIGLTYQSGRLVGSPALRHDMYGFGITKEKEPLFEVFSFSGQVTAENGKTFPLSGINKPGYLTMSGTLSDANALTLYNSLWGSTSRGNEGGLTGIVEVVIKEDVVQKILKDNPGIPIPPDGYVLRGHGQAADFITENLTVGSKVSYTYTVTPLGDNLFAAVGGQALLVEDGQLPAHFTQDIGGRHARTAVGTSRDGKTLYVVVVEKSAEPDGTVLSRGMSQEELAKFLISMGVWRAVNLDGGGSTTLVVRHLGEFDVSVVNRPQGDVLRRVPNAIGLFSTAPQGTLKGLLVSGPKVMIEETKGEFTVKGYDEYYNPVRVEQEEILWSAYPDAGDFHDNVFIPQREGFFNVQATLGKAKGTAELRVIGVESLSGLLVRPASIAVEPGGEIELSAQVRTKEGDLIDLEREDVEWTVDSSLGRIENGKFTAVKKVAFGEIKADFRGLTASIPVSVTPPSVELQIVPGKDSKASIDDRVSVEFPARSVDKPLKVSITYIDIPADVPQGCKPLSSIAVTPVEGQEKSLAFPWWINWRYSASDTSGRPSVMLWDPVLEKWREQPSGIDEEGVCEIVYAGLWSFGRVVLVDDCRPVPEFSDARGHWARPAIDNLAARRVIKGFPDGTYRPEQAVTRAQFVSLLSAALQWPSPASEPAFKDPIPDWARPSVAAAVYRGVVSGYPDGTFMPDARITRSEMAVMIDRALGLSDGLGCKLRYVDSAAIPDFARDAVARVSAAGLFQGSDGRFRPQDGATRAETAVAVNRVLNWWIKQRYFNQN